MGQAAVDLPDPMEKPAAAQVASADDLLAQLAGDEIDRLLAESDAGGVAAVTTNTVDTSKEPVPATGDNPACDHTGLNGGVGAEVGAAVVEPAPVVEAKAVSAAEEVGAEIDAEEKEQSEREALEEGEAVAPAVELPVSIKGLPFFLKPLGWMNAPLNYLPEEWRELVGKIAIWTMVNAIAVLTYVIVFRH